MRHVPPVLVEGIEPSAAECGIQLLCQLSYTSISFDGSIIAHDTGQNGFCNTVFGSKFSASISFFFALR